jgi:hypothetical protein
MDLYGVLAQSTNRILNANQALVCGNSLSLEGLSNFSCGNRSENLIFLTRLLLKCYGERGYFLPQILGFFLLLLTLRFDGLARAFSNCRP